MLNRSRILGLALLAAFALSHLTGCSYVRNRFNDVKDIGDFGITFSTKPGFAAYASGPFIQCIATGGFALVDGYYFGLGEGRVGFMPIYEECVGLLVWGQEEFTFFHTGEELAKMDEEKRHIEDNYMRVGALGYLDGPMPGLKYNGSCPHFFHFGWIGVSGGPRYLQMIDLVTSCFLLDICLDDNRDWEGFPPEKRTPAGKNELKEGIGLDPGGIGTYFSRIVHL